jgi:predicted metal-dependent hydrolase
VSWFRQHAEAYLPQRLAEVCSRHGLKKPVMAVGEQKARWGSCDARGTLRINWRIIQAPVSLVDYVLPGAAP